MFDLENSASHLLHRAQQVAANRSAAALRAAGITLRQFSVLSVIAQEEGVSQSHLVRATGIDRSTLADMAARMEKAKLIKRSVSKSDARAKSLSLMAAGRKALAQATPGVLEADRILMESLPATRRDSLLKTLTAVAGADEVEARPAPKPKAPAAPRPKIKAKQGTAAAKPSKAKKAKPKKKKRKS